MKKYLLVLSNLKLGGSERQAVNFARYLKKSGREVEILGLDEPGLVNKLCEEEGIPCNMLTEGNKWVYRALRVPCFVAIRICRQPYSPVELSMICTLAKYIKVNRFDICISYCSRANTILGCCKKLYKRSKYVWSQRDAGIFDSTEGYQKIAAHNVDCIIANGNSGKEWIRQGYGLEATLVYNGVALNEAEKSVEEWREFFNAGKTDLICTMVANLSSAKDHMSLLRAWKILKKKENKRLLLVLAGRFDDRYKMLYQYAADNDLLDNVRFLGQVEDITGLLAATDICVFGAISEGSPNGIIEAAMAGLPVVATDLPEIREVVAEENYEYLFPKDDVEMIVNNVLFLADNAEIRVDLGKKNQKKAMDMFSIEKNYKQMIEMMEAGDM